MNEKALAVLKQIRQLWASLSNAKRIALMAVTSAGAAVPRGWQLDTHVVESGADALLELLRKRDQRRRAGSKDA